HQDGYASAALTFFPDCRVMRRMPTIAVDAMGGDNAPEAVVEGVADVSLATDIQCILVGDEAGIQKFLEGSRCNPENIQIVHAAESIGMEEDPRQAVRDKRNASILVAARLIQEERADALVAAGNTGAAVLSCVRHLRMIPGVRRTALASVYPRKTE